MKFHCKICDKSFTKFVLFEGHFDFSDPCREKQSSYIQCYICSSQFRNSASLKYHIQQHTIQRVKKVKPIVPQLIRIPVIPKIRLEKQWNFKVAPQVQKIVPQEVKEEEEKVPTKNEEPTNGTQLECKRCGKKFRNLFHLAQHSTVHEKLIHEQNENKGPASGISSQTNEKGKSESIVSVPGGGVPRPTAKSRNPNQCTVCKIVLKHTHGGRLERHMQFHIDGKFKCEICNIKFSRQSLGWHRVKFHRTLNHQSQEYVAIRPTQKYDEMSSLENAKRRCKICKAIVKIGNVEHMQNHRTGKFKCEICNIRFSHRSLVWHQRRFHPEIDIYTCTICKATLKSAQSQKRHLIIHKIGDVKCELCNIRFTPNSLVHHQKIFHPDLPRLLVGQSCSICKIVCRTKAALDEHADMHQNGKFQCEEHQIKFTFEALQTHNRSFHAKQSSTCPTCKLKLSGPMRLEQHMKVHTFGYVNCEICSIPFTNNSLIYHQRIFHREFYHGVMQSERKIRQMLSKNLKRKRMRREKIIQARRHQCSYCKLFFDDAKRLEIHVAVHTEGDVECRICKIPFTKNSLLSHEKRFHADVMRKERILKAIHRHRSDELRALNGLETDDIPAILEDQYKQLKAEHNLKDQCLICKLPCGDSKKLDTHITVHIEGDYKCEICSVWFTKNSLDFHQKRFHPEFYKERIANGIRLMKEQCGDGKLNEFSEKKNLFRQECDICKVNVHGRREKMDDHKQTHITGEAECKVCNIRFTTMALRYHQKRFHPSEFRPISHEHKCTVCKLKFSDAKSLDTHMTVHIDADTQCDICNIPFTVPSLRYHMKRFHAGTLSTEVLQKALERNNMVEKAANAPNPLNFNRCPICNIAFRYNRKRIYEHIKVHVDGDVKCSVCQIWFTPASLDCHYKRVHPGLYVPNKNRNETQHQCNVCKLVSYDESRLKEHMKVHLGNVKCPICDIPFTKPSLVYHYKRFHPNLQKNERILKSIENTAPRKNLHSCAKCGKSFTRICYLKLHIKYHRNAVEPVEIPFVFNSSLPTEPASIEIPFDFNALLSVEPNSSCSETNQSTVPTTVKTRNYECYVCKQPYKIACEMQDHLHKHVVHEQWVDPLDVYLSNWGPDELSEIISEQPIVLVENLDIRHINLKFLADNDRSNKNSIEKLHDVNENFTETNLQIIQPVAANDYTAPDTTRNGCDDDVVEILSDSDDETIRHQLNANNARRHIGPEWSVTTTENYTTTTNEPVYISSDDEGDNYDITNSFHCYFCNGRFMTLVQFGEHGKICHLKGEPDL